MALGVPTPIRIAGLRTLADQTGWQYDELEYDNIERFKIITNPTPTLKDGGGMLNVT